MIPRLPTFSTPQPPINSLPERTPPPIETALLRRCAELLPVLISHLDEHLQTERITFKGFEHVSQIETFEEELSQALQLQADIAAALTETGPLDPNVEALRQRLHDRSQAGLRKYGTTTARADFAHADWLRHLQEELLDAAIYAEAILSKEAAR